MEGISNEAVNEVARNLFDGGDIDYTIDKYGSAEIDTWNLPDVDNYEYSYGTVAKETLDKAIELLTKLISSVKFYVGDNGAHLELNDNRTLWNINAPDGYEGEFDNEYYQYLVDQALDEFEERTGVKAYQDGRMGRHIVVDITFDNMTRFDELKEVQESLEADVIKRAEDECFSVAEEVTESLNKGEKQVRCLSCGTDVIYTNRDVEHDIDGDYIECPNCHATFDVDYDAIEPLLNKKTESKEQWYGYNLIGEYTDKDGVKHTDEISHAFNTEYLKHYAEEHKNELTKYDNIYIKDTAVNEITTTDGIINKDKRIQVTEAEDMSKVKDDVKNAVDKSDSTDMEKDQVKGSIDVLKTDEESAIAGYDEFTKETAKVVDKELADEIDNQMQEIKDDEEEHIEKLDTIKSALGESKEAPRLTGDETYVARNSSGYKSIGLIIDNTNKQFQIINGQVMTTDSKTKKMSKKQIRDKAQQLYDNGYTEYDGYGSVAQGVNKKEELFNNSINLNVDAGDIASGNNLDLGGLGALAGLMASEETKKSDDKLEEADETSGTDTQELNTDLVPIINMYQYDIYNMFDEHIGVTREKLDEMMLDFAEPLIEEQIKDVLPSAQITFGEFTHPQYYRAFSNLNDVLDFNVTYNIAEYEALKEKAIADPEFEQYLKDHYTSYDGFMSFFANNISEFEEQEDWKQFVSVLSYYLPNNVEQNVEDMELYVMEEAGNHDIMLIDGEVDYVVDEINNKVSNGEIELNKENIINITKDLMDYLDEEDQEIIINGVLEAFDLEESKKEELFDNTADININANDIASNNNVDLGGLGDLLGMTEAKAIEMKKTENKEGVNN